MATVKSRLRKLARLFLFMPIVKNLLMKLPGIRRIYSPLYGTHPFDKEFRIETSGFVDNEEIHPNKQLILLINPYLGSQPSIVRRALSALETYRDYTFVDYGCGKGRAVVVAGEFPFQSVMGIELSPTMVATARSNAAKVASRFPDRPCVKIVNANVCDFPLPQGRLTCFNANAFGREILAQVIMKFETALAADTPHMFFIYYNPVHFDLLDASPAFKRFYAQQIPYDRSEVGFGPDRDDAVVIWQSARGAIPQHQGADRKIIITKPGNRAELAN